MFNSLFQPYVLKGKTIKNRCVVPAMVANYCTRDGKATEKYLSYHEAKAKGGWGLIITEDYAVDPKGCGFKFVAGLWEDAQIESHSELPKRVHKYGSTILAQIYHCGRQTNESVIGGMPVAPSPIPCPFSPNDIPKELTIDEIREIIEKFGDTARRAQQCGFDGIEIHGGHGYLVAQFLSPYSNKRIDEYGGSFANRTRFAVEIVKDIRQKCGDDFILGFRISVDEFVEGGRTIEESKAIVSLLEQAGVDIIHASAGVYASCDTIVPPSYVRHAWTADMAAEIKSSCSIPVISVGRINQPQIADSVIRAGKADFTAMGRASLVDPDMPNKAQNGELEDIRQCIGCNHGCLGLLFSDNPIKCVLNPRLGEEYLPLEKTESAKKIAIVGAGPAGLEAAIFAAQSGHDVRVYEKSNSAGGQFRLAAVPPFKGEITAFIQWQLAQLKKLGVTIEYGTEVTPEILKENGYEKVLVATGAESVIPGIKGIDLPHVVTANDVLAGTSNVGGRVVVIGGGQVGAETANHLGVQLKAVTLVEQLADIAAEEAVAPRWHLLRSLEGRKVQMLTNTKVVEITSDAVKVEKDGAAFDIPSDSVVVAAGSRPVDMLSGAIEQAGIPVAVIGDAGGIGLVLDATMQGYQAAGAI